MGGGTPTMPAMGECKYTPWRLCEPEVRVASAEMLGLLLRGGQAFRWRAAGREGVFCGVFADCVAQLRQGPCGRLQWRCPTAIEARVAAALPVYLDAHRDYDAARDCLPWRSDSVLTAAMRVLPGLRLLKQPFAETLLCYLCSSTKRIEQIRVGCDAMAERFGEALAGGAHALPTWERLAGVSEEQLRGCGLGYRARYITATARSLAACPCWLAETEHLPFAEARERLMGLPGVGGKIADCVLLYGGGVFEAFPTDTWILQAMARRYGLSGWKPEQVAQFGRVHFGPFAGLAQQYVFEAERLGRL